MSVAVLNKTATKQAIDSFLLTCIEIFLRLDHGLIID